MKFLAFVLLISTAHAAKLLPGTYNLDPDHTRVSFTIGHMVVSKVEGRFNDVTGSFTVGEKFKDTKLDVTIQTDSVDTGVLKRDSHLKTADFFEVKKFPTMTFKSTSVSGSEGKFSIKGQLTIKDVTKEVSFAVKHLGSAKNPQGKEFAAFTAEAKINRKDFHVNYDQQTPIGPAVGDEVEIKIISELVKE